MSGTLKTLTGRMREAFGALTGNKSLKTKAKAQQAVGKVETTSRQGVDRARESARENIEQAKEKAEDTVEKAKKG